MQGEKFAKQKARHAGQDAEHNEGGGSSTRPEIVHSKNHTEQDARRNRQEGRH